MRLVTIPSGRGRAALTILVGAMLATSASAVATATTVPPTDTATDGTATASDEVVTDYLAFTGGTEGAADESWTRSPSAG